MSWKIETRTHYPNKDGGATVEFMKFGGPAIYD